MIKVKKTTKKAVLFCGVMLASLVSAGLLVQTNSVEASADATASSYAKIQGAAVRYAAQNDTTGNGLRFTYTVDKNNDFGTDFANVENMGMLIIPTSLLGEGEELTHATQNVSNTKFIENGNTVEGHPINVGTYENNTFTKTEEGNTYGMFVYVWNLPESMYNQDFTCVGYYQLNGDSIRYTASLERSVAYVARAAYDANNYVSDEQKTSLEAFLLDYTATYDAGEGTASVASESLEYGKAPTATATLSGYEFDFWGVNGEKVEKITKDVTLSAYYKKDGGASFASLQNGVSFDYAGTSFVSVKLGDTDVSAHASVAGGKLTIAKDAFATEGTYTLTVNETAFKKTTYSLTVANADNAPFVFADASNIVAASQFSYNNNKYMVHSDQTYDGRSGLIRIENYVSDVDGFAMTANLQSKAYYEALYDVENTYVTFEFYITSSSTEQKYWDINGADSGWGNETGNVTVGKWHRISTSLSDILNHYDEIATAYATANTGVNLNKGWLFRALIPTDKTFNMYMTPMYFTTADIDDMDTVVHTAEDGVDVGSGQTKYEADYTAASLAGYTITATLGDNAFSTAEVTLPAEEGTYTYTVYAEKNGVQYTVYVAKVALANSTLERAFANVSTTGNAKAVEYGSTSSKATLSVVNETNGLPTGKTGDYYKVAFTGEEPGIKVLPDVSLGMLEMYSDGVVRFDYYVETANTTTVHILRRSREPQDGSSEYYQVATIEKGKWYTVEIPVSEFLATVTDKLSDGTTVTTTVYDRIVEGYTSNQHNGKLFSLGWANASNGAFYVGNMRLVSKEVIDAELEAEMSTPLVWQEMTADSSVVRGYHYGNKDNKVTVINATDIDSNILAGRTIESTQYYKYTNNNPNDWQEGIKVATSLTQTELQSRVGGYLEFEYYFGITDNSSYNGTQALSIKTMYNNDQSPYSTDTSATSYNTWKKVQIPVQYILDNYASFSTITGNRAGMIIESAWFGGAGSVVIYLSEMKVVAPQA